MSKHPSSVHEKGGISLGCRLHTAYQDGQSSLDDAGRGPWQLSHCMCYRELPNKYILSQATAFKAVPIRAIIPPRPVTSACLTCSNCTVGVISNDMQLSNSPAACVAKHGLHLHHRCTNSHPVGNSWAPHIPHVAHMHKHTQIPAHNQVQWDSSANNSAWTNCAAAATGPADTKPPSTQRTQLLASNHGAPHRPFTCCPATHTRSQ